MIFGIIPASGKASRMGSLPKFSLPCDAENTSLLKKQVELMGRHVDKIIVSTTRQWKPLVKSFNLPVEIVTIEPSTMNDAVLKIANKYEADNYLIGMADTYFVGENPYTKLAQMLQNNSIAIACWKIDSELKGRVGQVKLTNGTVLDVLDKVKDCKYPHMWGALGFKRDTLFTLDKNNSHPGIDLPLQLKKQSVIHQAFEVKGNYFDVGTLRGYRNLLNKLEL
jgi:hypothetical protein